MALEDELPAQTAPTPDNFDSAQLADPSQPDPAPPPGHNLRWIFVGSQGLRAGWSIVITIVLLLLIGAGLSTILVRSHLIAKGSGAAIRTMFLSELATVLALLGAVAVTSRIEHRRILDYNLHGPRPLRHFFTGLASGFLALSLLIGALAAGGWLHFGPVSLSGLSILRYGAVWACVFLLVGCAEEGIFRCYLQYTLTRGINFWWALALVAAICGGLAATTKGNGPWGVYAVAILGLFPCLGLHLRLGARGAFWHAAWVTSTFFGFVHTGNGGENWIGIFAAAAIGFAFCVSIRLTGSAWWAIGCHAAWDWAETFFYGTADSGMKAHGHLLDSQPAGNALWSGGADGPEGSLLVLGVILLLLVFIYVVYGRRNLAAQQPEPASLEPASS